MEESRSFLRFILIGQLQREYIITPDQKALLDIPGGNLLYSGLGLRIWENAVGLVSRVGEDFPQPWLDKLENFGFDIHGIHRVMQYLDLRYFTAYQDFENSFHESPVSQFARLGISIPKSLLGYNPPIFQPDSKTQTTDFTIRANDLPAEYLDATAAHICPCDFLTHKLLPSALHKGNILTITLDPGEGYMQPIFWDDIPGIVNGITAFIVSEKKISTLFKGKSSDLWEMAETIASYGCDIVVINRGLHGQHLFDRAKNQRWIIPAYPSRVVSPHGISEAFCGGFLAGYRTTYDALQAAIHGNISASFVIESDNPFYALDALPGLAQARMESLNRMVQKV